MTKNVENMQQEGTISVLKLFYYPFKKINEKFMDFLFLTVLVALANTFISIVCGRSFVCDLRGEGLFCSSSATLFIVSFVFRLFLFSYYIYRCYLILEKGEKFDFVIREKIGKMDFKVLGGIFLYLLYWVVFGITAYLLTTRKATENFSLEVVFFVAMSGLIIFSGIYLLSSFLLIGLMENEKWWQVNKVLLPLFDCFHKMLFAFLIYFFMFYYLFKLFMLDIIRQQNVVLQIVSNFSLELYIYFVLAFFMLSLSYQYQCLKPRN